MRSARQTKILEIISVQEIETQDDLIRALKQDGYTVTQATVSRDIKELGLTKVLSENKKYKYVNVDSGEKTLSGKLLNLLRESVISIVSSENLIVIKTLPGAANSAASAIDKINIGEMLGCIAGDDTILIVVNGSKNVPAVIGRIKELIY
ncbi:MAG: arginine repressor [Clostridia bacterium]|nr:arginine repressor [Clostridia bacterium]